MECNEPAAVDKLSEQTADIAVSHKNLRIVVDLLKIQSVQQMVCPVSPSRAHNRANILVEEHFFEFPRTPLRRSRKIKIAIQNRVQVDRLVASPSQRGASRFEFLALEITRGRDDSDRISRVEGGRLDELAGRSRHEATLRGAGILRDKSAAPDRAAGLCSPPCESSVYLRARALSP